MSRRDIHGSVDVVQSLVPREHLAAGFGTGVDLKGFNAAQAVIVVGAIGGANALFTFRVQESDDDSPGSYSNVAEDDLQGASKVPVVSGGDQVLRIGYLGNKRFIRILLMASGGTGPRIFAAGLIVRGLPSLAPVPDSHAPGGF